MRDRACTHTARLLAALSAYDDGRPRWYAVRASLWFVFSRLACSELDRSPAPSARRARDLRCRRARARADGVAPYADAGPGAPGRMAPGATGAWRSPDHVRLSRPALAGEGR